MSRPAALLVLLLAAAPAAAADPLAGRWVGSWHSDTTGHSGPLRARVTPRGDGTYRVLFAGRFAGVVPFVYPATFAPTADGRLAASRNLGPLLGTFSTTAAVTPASFDASFRSRRDAGRFALVRP